MNYKYFMYGGFAPLASTFSFSVIYLFVSIFSLTIFSVAMIHP